MIEYAVAWHPASDNLGDDLRTLAASRLLPRIDRALDADRPDAPLEGLTAADRVVTLFTGAFLRSAAHWPPQEQIAPVYLGAHFSSEDTWGVPFESLSGAGRSFLTACGEVGCRDERTLRLMEQANIPAQLTACVTLSLDRPDVPKGQPYVCCVDTPAEVAAALREFAPGVGAQVQETTHQLDSPSRDFAARMAHAEDVVRTYAGAAFVVTRRLHCAMVCLAVGTPVVLLYNSGYEDVSRFAPMDAMVRTQPVEDFVAEVYRNGFPVAWRNPEGVKRWKEKLLLAARHGIAAAEALPLPVVDAESARLWREQRQEDTIRAAEEKIHRLEQERYEGLHEKFGLLMKEDAAKTAMTALLREPEVERALRRLAWRRVLQTLPWYKRPLMLWRLWRGQAEAADLLKEAITTLRPLGWPEK